MPMEKHFKIYITFLSTLIIVCKYIIPFTLLLTLRLELEVGRLYSNILKHRVLNATQGIIYNSIF